MKNSLTGKVALVTGGSRGIGAAIATRLAEEGADVAFTYLHAADKALSVVKKIEGTGQNGLAIQADSAVPEAVIRAVNQTAAKFGRFDILVNNAGIFPYGSFEEVSLEEIDRTLAIHVRAVFVAVQAAVRYMNAGGRIISIGSCLADRVPDPGVALYAMSKSALNGLTKGLARDLGPRGITVNVVHPGSTDTDMNPAVGPGAEYEKKHIALGHYGHVNDIAAMVAHLAGEGGRYVTGASIAVDGGFGA
ncbi:SDR family oxidoreductase [Paenibacillus mesophilus]|uniref:SDR family NAD(P)-dependent oxidoreductase n=1 Tax=Paenibacillus mesophilus TaxID=2582849 RepID=UPI00110D6600|nr:SDR family oxidoreductase [Paenibacillus mesophilus]TMV48367.1 SDR family oxidoreductase [Paenibacillus mesophilus]